MQRACTNRRGVPRRLLRMLVQIVENRFTRMRRMGSLPFTVRSELPHAESVLLLRTGQSPEEDDG